MSESITLTCPYCGERFVTQADPSAGAQRYVEDCAVCCCPIEVVLEVDDEGRLRSVTTHRDDD